MAFVLDVFRLGMTSDIVLVFLYPCLVEIKHGRLMNWSQSFLEAMSSTQCNWLQVTKLTSTWNLASIILSILVSIIDYISQFQQKEDFVAQDNRLPHLVID